MKVYLGMGGTPAEALDVTIGEVYTYDGATNTYTKQDAASFATASTHSAGDCSCNNALSEISYTVTMGAEGENYKITGVKADVVL